MNGLEEDIPKTVNRATMLLVSYLSLRDKKKIKKMAETDLARLNVSLGSFIHKEFKLSSNDLLIESCCSASREFDVDSDEATCIIIKELWKRLRVLYN